MFPVKMSTRGKLWLLIRSVHMSQKQKSKHTRPEAISGETVSFPHWLGADCNAFHISLVLKELVLEK